MAVNRVTELKYQVAEVICLLSRKHTISAGNAEGLQHCCPPVPEIPPPPPSYPLILDRDPVPEELVRLNVHLPPNSLHCELLFTPIINYIYTKTLYMSLILSIHGALLICFPVPAVSFEPGVGGLRIRLGL